jgi:hypothetical protein
METPLVLSLSKDCPFLPVFEEGQGFDGNPSKYYFDGTHHKLSPNGLGN